MSKFLRILGVIISWVIIVFFTLWASAALYFDLPYSHLGAPVAAFFVMIVLAVMVGFKQHWLRLAVFLEIGRAHV